VDQLDELGVAVVHQGEDQVDEALPPGPLEGHLGARSAGRHGLRLQRLVGDERRPPLPGADVVADRVRRDRAEGPPRHRGDGLLCADDLPHGAEHLGEEVFAHVLGDGGPPEAIPDGWLVPLPDVLDACAGLAALHGAGLVHGASAIRAGGCYPACYPPGTTVEPGSRAIDIGPVRALLSRVEAAIHPEQVWLFGSRARGEATQGSDWDLFVVVPDETSDELLDLRALWRLTRGAGVPVDLVACRASEFREACDTVNTLSYVVAMEGVRVDDR
jgi:uncharacterized protein